MSGKITITNKSAKVAVIDIEGVIGIPEQNQFEEPGQRIATYEKFRKSIEKLRDIPNPQIIVNIRSTGGNVNDALLIYDALASLDATITTKCYGYVASAATIIAQAASPKNREISANSLYLIHKSTCSAEGNSQEIKQSLEMLDKTDERIAEIYAKRSGKPEKSFITLMNENDGNGRWLSPAETIQYGLADRVTGKTQATPRQTDLENYEALPPLPTTTDTIKQMIAMNISKQWSTLMKVLGFEAENEARNQKEEQAPQNIQKEEAANDRAAEKNIEIPENAVKQINDLKAQISVLEAQNARLAALPTVTIPKEDPSTQEKKYTTNQEAYMKDLEGFI